MVGLAYRLALIGEWEFESLDGRRWVLVKWHHGCLQNSSQGFDSLAPCQVVAGETRCDSSVGRASPCRGEGHGIETRTHRQIHSGHADHTRPFIKTEPGPRLVRFMRSERFVGEKSQRSGTEQGVHRSEGEAETWSTEE